MIGHIQGDMKEVSGLVSSPAHPGVAWMIRDSGNPTILYSFEFDGGTPGARKLPVAGTENGDWEDIAYTTAADGRGRLWILDNRSKRTSPKRIYEVAEPDPGREKRAELLGTYRWEYPDNGGNYDTETFFALEGVLHVITKAETNRVYRFDAPLSPTGLNHPAYLGTGRAGHPLRVRFDHGRRAALRRLLHQAGHRLGLRGGRPAGSGSHRHADLQPGDGVFPAQGAGDFFPARGCDLVLVSEDRTVWRPVEPPLAALVRAEPRSMLIRMSTRFSRSMAAR